MTNYEMTVLLGIREQQLLSGAPYDPRVKVLDKFKMSKQKVAILELLDKKTPMVLLRTNNATKTKEKWKVSELNISQVRTDLERML